MLLHRLPAVYTVRFFVTSGGLISYGPDRVDQFRRAAGYVDRILKGENAADLPVQAPTKYELAINLKTAKALGLDVPPMSTTAAGSEHLVAAFRKGLNEIGFIEGQLAIECRFADDRLDRLLPVDSVGLF